MARPAQRSSRAAGAGARAPGRPGRTRQASLSGWRALPPSELLDVRIRDLDLTIEGCALEERLGITLGKYYRRKQRVYQSEVPAADDPADARREKAVLFLRRYRAELRNRIAGLTGQQAYVVDQVVNELILRCKKLDLRLARSPEDTLVDAGILLATLTMSFVYGGHPDYQR